MPDYLLYQMPGSCSRVALVALEQIGLPYRDRPVSLITGEHFGPAFVALNPKSKVPVLVADGIVITELPAILAHLATAHPAAGLLPLETGHVPLASLSDLVWLAGGVHPLASRIFRPFDYSQSDQDGVKTIALGLLARAAALISDRLADRPWWNGETWSINDAFIAWIFGVAGPCGFPLHDFPQLADHCARAEVRPSYRRARERERAA